MTATRVEIDAPAKVNLRLQVLARESSGYHSLESLFCAIDLADTVSLDRGGGGVQLELQGAIDTGPAEQNLAVRAARRFLAEIGEEGAGVRVRLHKRIPAAAGLGGGSSDAAATLRAMNRLYGDALDDDALLRLGSELGSDVPFFLGGSPLALGWSRGERLLALPPLPEAAVLVAHPGEGMPTGGAFQKLGKLRGGEYRPRAFRLHSADLSGWDRVAAVAGNDFETVAVAEIPRLAGALGALRESGALIALLAGSGASVFGVFPDPSGMSAAEQRLCEAGFTCWRCRTLDSFPDARTPPPGTA